MKSWMRLVVAVALILFSAPLAMADIGTQGGEIQGIGSGPIKIKQFLQDTNADTDFGPNTLIIGMKCISLAATGYCAIADGATFSGGTMIDDISEPTAGDTNVQMWPRPYKLVTDLSVDVATSSILYVYYQ